jgi:RNA polymerase sigma factor (sigma-70 family)
LTESLGACHRSGSAARERPKKRQGSLTQGARFSDEKSRGLPLLKLRRLALLESSAAVTRKTSEVFVQRPARPALYSIDSIAVAFEPAERPRGVPQPSKTTDNTGTATSERDLGQALIEGRPYALPAAWRRYYPMVHAMLRRALGADADIEDVVQDVFLCLLRRAHALRDKDAIRPFVIGITRRTLSRELRRRRRRQQLSMAYSFYSAQSASIGSGPGAGYAAIKLHQLLQRLTEQERISFVLRFAHGMTLPEVAGVLRVSEPTAKRRLAAARARLCAWAATDRLLLEHLRGKDVGLTDVMAC